MEYTLKALCQKLNLSFVGDGNIIINHVCGLENIRDGGLAFITNPEELSDLPTPKGIFDSRQKDIDSLNIAGKAAIIVPENVTSDRHNLIFSNDPIAHHIQATSLIHPFPLTSQKIHPSAVIGNNVQIGENATIDAQVVLYDNVKIGSGAVIRAGTVIMENASVGDHSQVYPNVTIRENCQIGNRVIIHAGAVIGSDGFGFYQRSGKNRKIPQIGTVIIEDDVEIGSCTTIDRARFNSTIVRKGSKLDNLIHIAHNVELGEDSLIAAQSGIAGSSTTGHHLMMGGQSGIRDNLKIGSSVTLLARTLITSKTADNEIVAGMPSRPIRVWRQIQALINSLDSLFERVKRLEQRSD